MKPQGRLKALGLVVAVVVIVIAVVTGYQFIPQAAEYGDGFASQLATARVLLSDGVQSGLIDESWLPILHVVRLMIVEPFLIAEELLGPAGSAALLLFFLWPLTCLPGSTKRSLLTLVPLFLPVLVSGRGVLVAVAVGYVVTYLLDRRRSWMLWAGIIFANLSSASVLICFVLLIAGLAAPAGSSVSLKWGGQRILATLLLGISISLSLIDKFEGFNAGAPGYNAYAFESENVLLSVISRSTFIVSLVEGQTLRVVAYGVFAVLLLIKLVATLADPNRRLERRIVLCCIPSLLMEGLGVVSMIFPLVWLLQGFPGVRAQKHTKP